MFVALLAMSLAAASDESPTCRATGLADAVSRYATSFEHQKYHEVSAFFGPDGVMYGEDGKELARGSMDVERVLVDPSRFKPTTHAMGAPKSTLLPEGWETRGSLKEFTIIGPGRAAGLPSSSMEYEGSYVAIWHCVPKGWMIVRMGYGDDGIVTVNAS